MSDAIRLAVAADAPAIAAIYAPFVASTTISFEVEPPDAAHMADRIARTVVRYPWLVFERDGRVGGYAYATRHRERQAYQWSVDTSAYVHPDHWRRGIGRRLYQSLIAMLAAQGFVNAYAGIALPNPASIALHESVGYRPLGIYRSVGYKLGAWHDVGWWELRLRAPDANPSPPVDIASMIRRQDWDQLLASGMRQDSSS
jgi:L-amino acid N-acyltransferase YncA